MKGKGEGSGRQEEPLTPVSSELWSKREELNGKVSWVIVQFSGYSCQSTGKS